MPLTSAFIFGDFAAQGDHNQKTAADDGGDLDQPLSFWRNFANIYGLRISYRVRPSARSGEHHRSHLHGDGREQGRRRRGSASGRLWLAGGEIALLSNPDERFSCVELIATRFQIERGRLG